MYITDVVIEKESIKLIQQKICVALTFIVLMFVGVSMSVASIVYGLVEKITDYNTYLFSAFGIVISAFWLVVLFKELKNSKSAKQQILERGSYVHTTPVNVDARRKYNITSILNLICAIFVFACFVAVVVMQIIKFNPLTIYTIAISFVLAVFMFYQAIISIINDKIFRNTIYK